MFWNIFLFPKLSETVIVELSPQKKPTFNTIYKGPIFKYFLKQVFRFTRKFKHTITRNRLYKLVVSASKTAIALLYLK